MSAVTVAIAPQPLEFTVQALQALWAVPNLQEIPATPHELILGDIWASEDTTEKPRKERKPRRREEHSRIKCAVIDTVVSCSPGAWLSESIVDCLLSEGRPKIEDQTGIERPTISKQLARVSEIGMEYIAAKKGAK
jgi:hypothetical protein